VIRINPREKQMIIFGGCFVVALLIYALVVSPYLKAMELMDRRIAGKTEELREVLALQQEYSRLKEKTKFLERMVQSTPGFSLLSFLENLATRNQVKGQIAYMKPVTTPASERYRESSVEMKLENITLKQLVDYLYGIEESKESIRIKRLNVMKNKETALLDVTLQASTFELLESTRGG
jgi:general secretion pathway protein M